jgi:phosphatidylglycerol lysyltransferase
MGSQGMRVGKKVGFNKFIACLTLLSGAVNLYSAINPSLSNPRGLLRELAPIEFLRHPRSFTLLLGLALIVSSVNIWRRKRRAYHLTLALASLSALSHVFKGDPLELTLGPMLLIALLVWRRREFTVKCSLPDWRGLGLRLALMALSVFIYGVAGFWLLDVREFGVNFHWADAIRSTMLYLTFAGDPSIAPHTRYAAWFLDSLYALSAAMIVYALVALFHPILYRYRTLPQERSLAAEIVRRHGRSSLDFFKLWPDKAYFFNAARDCFIAYGVNEGFAVALGDPVGPAEKIEATLREFQQYCEDNGWGTAFYQTLPDFLPEYQRAGFKKLRIGDAGLVDLSAFSLSGAAHRKLRSTVKRLEAAGARYRRFEPPIDDETLGRFQEVSDEWLSLPGRRERGFSLGLFDRHYLRRAPAAAVEDARGRILAFINVIPSGRPGATTIDLMRHRADAPNGVMDFLFTKHFSACREQGFRYFDLGMAPLSSFTEKEEASATEKAVAFFLRRLEFLFSFGGIRHFKAKYATRWEPRYVIYKRATELPRLGIALTKIAEFKPQGPRLTLIHSALATEPAAPEIERPTSQLSIGFQAMGQTIGQPMGQNLGQSLDPPLGRASQARVPSGAVNQEEWRGA